MTKIAMRTYFFDASAIVKMVVDEPGSKKVKLLLDECLIAHTSWILLAEVLGCLKRKRLKGDITEAQYANAVFMLFGYIKRGDLDAIDIEIERGKARLTTHELEMFDHHHRFPDLDVADTLQLTVIKETFLGSYLGESQTHLVTADRELGKAAEAERIPVIYVNSD